MTTRSHPLVKQRLALAVRRLGVRNAAEETVAASVFGGRHVERDNQKHNKDDNGEDPLQSNDLDGDLLDSQRWIYILAHTSVKKKSTK